MERRAFLTTLAASVAAGLAACSTPAAKPTAPGSGATKPGGAASSGTVVPPSDAPVLPAGRVFQAPTGLVKVPVPHGTLAKLPGKGQRIALTVDDGSDPRVVGAYVDLARITGLRLTFFVNGVNRGWTDHAGMLRPLVESGDVFLANHTWSHPDLRKLGSAGISDEVKRNEAFLINTYGVTGRPFLRPPFGSTDSRVRAQLADMGYPASTLWLGSLGDAIVQTPDAIVRNAKQWFLPQSLVIGHANHPPVTKVMDQLVEIIKSRGLEPVHLGDVFDTNGAEIPKGPTPPMPPLPSSWASPSAGAKPAGASPSPSAKASAKPSAKPTVKR